MLAHSAIWLVVLSLSLGTAAIEVSTVLLAVVCVWQQKRIPPIPSSLLLYGAIAMCSIRVPGDVIEVLGKWWLFAPLIFLPPLLSERTEKERNTILKVGCWAMGMLGLVGCWQFFNGGVGHGWYSHHLSFGYMLLMPLAYTVHHRLWGAALLLFLGVVSTQAEGPLYSAAAILCMFWFSPKHILVMGSFGVCGLFLWFSEQPYFQERVAIWQSALNVLQEYPMGTGVTQFREVYTIAQARLESPMYFPHHAHDSALQQALWFGVPIWVAWGQLLRDWWSWEKWGKMMLVAIILGSFTEDTFGDMEILRSLLIFGCFAQVFGETSKIDSRLNEPKSDIL